MLDEFHGMCMQAAAGNPKLKQRLENALVFKLTLENGTSRQISNDGGHEIGGRMLFQLIRDSSEESWPPSLVELHKCHPAQVLNKLCMDEGRNPKDTTFLILVDGIHRLEHTFKQQDSKLKCAINSLADVVLGHHSFCIAAMSATFYSSIDYVFAHSKQLRTVLIPPPLDGHKVIETTDPLLRLLIDDMGGHGRALEALAQAIREVDLQTCSASTLMNRIRFELEQRYKPGLTRILPHLVQALIAVLVQHQFHDETAEIPNSPLKVEDVIDAGFFHWNSNSHTLECPFVFVWMLASYSRHPALAAYQLDAYHEIQKQTNRPDIPIGLQCWQHWEEHTAYFRMLKSSLLKGMTVQFSELHAGALIGKDRNLPVEVTELKQFVRAVHQYPTNGKKFL
jgi:hypothetical protein